jgi:hypothetical protein
MYTPILTRTIVCPRCGNKTMRKSVGKSPMGEYFDDTCHSYFTIEELVNEWNYDLGDFGDVGNHKDRVMLEVFSKGFVETQKWLQGREVILDVEKWEALTYPDAVSVVDEPEWEDLEQRLRDYEIVERMFLGIPEWSMEDYSVDTGAIHG